MRWQTALNTRMHTRRSSSGPGMVTSSRGTSPWLGGRLFVWDWECSAPRHQWDSTRCTFISRWRSSHGGSRLKRQRFWPQRPSRARGSRHRCGPTPSHRNPAPPRVSARHAEASGTAGRPDPRFYPAVIRVLNQSLRAYRLARSAFTLPDGPHEGHAGLLIGREPCTALPAAVLWQRHEHTWTTSAGAACDLSPGLPAAAGAARNATNPPSCVGPLKWLKRRNNEDKAFPWLRRASIRCFTGSIAGAVGVGLERGHRCEGAVAIVRKRARTESQRDVFLVVAD